MIKKWSVSYPAVNGTEQRRAYVYLPTMYEAEPDRRFPVLYMFDGQNVFFDEDATYGKSWGAPAAGWRSSRSRSTARRQTRYKYTGNAEKRSPFALFAAASRLRSP